MNPKLKDETFIDDATANYPSFPLGLPGTEILIHREFSNRAAILFECAPMNTGFILTGTWDEIKKLSATLQDAIAHIER